MAEIVFLVAVHCYRCYQLKYIHVDNTVGFRILMSSRMYVIIHRLHILVIYTAASNTNIKNN